MYHIIKDVASLITLSSEKHSLTAKGRHFKTQLIDMFYICAGHREHRQNTQVISKTLYNKTVNSPQNVKSLSVLSPGIGSWN